MRRSLRDRAFAGLETLGVTNGLSLPLTFGIDTRLRRQGTIVDRDGQPRTDPKFAPNLDRDSDRRHGMRIVSISLLVFASSASAQSPPAIDCDAIKNSTVPVELTYHSQSGTRTVVQSYRSKSGDGVVWSRQTPPSNHPNPPVIVAKGTYVDGFLASGELWTNYIGKYSHEIAKYTAEGLPKNFDHRSDINYKVHVVTTDGDDVTAEKNSTISYMFKSAETIAVGACVLQVIHGETNSINDANRTRHTFQVIFPELRISAMAADAEPIVDSLSTVFSEIKPAN